MRRNFYFARGPEYLRSGLDSSRSINSVLILHTDLELVGQISRHFHQRKISSGEIRENAIQDRKIPIAGQYLESRDTSQQNFGKLTRFTTSGSFSICSHRLGQEAFGKPTNDHSVNLDLQIKKSFYSFSQLFGKLTQDYSKRSDPNIRKSFHPLSQVKLGQADCREVDLKLLGTPGSQQEAFSFILQGQVRLGRF